VILFLTQEVLMAVSKTTVQAVLDKFKQENPGPGAQKAHISDEDRTWQEQLGFIILRPGSYPNIVANFLKKFKLKALPKQKDLSPEQLTWWETEIMKQAGKSPGFPHVGGKAIDVGVSTVVPLELKVKLYDMLIKQFKVLLEKGADYKVKDPKLATCFHCYD
jgi:hypothetical protein